MAEPVGWLRAVVVDVANPSELAEFWQAVLGVGVVETVPDWLPLPPDVARKAYGPKGTPG